MSAQQSLGEARSRDLNRMSGDRLGKRIHAPLDERVIGTLPLLGLRHVARFKQSPRP